MKRAVSSSSETSDIRVAPLRSPETTINNNNTNGTPATMATSDAGAAGNAVMLDGIDDYARRPFVSAELREQGRVLVVRAPPERLRELLNDGGRRKRPINLVDNDDGEQGYGEEGGESFARGEGPNRRGTYSKDYTLRHPEIRWVHRGQGRYLPADEVKRDSTVAVPVRRSRYVFHFFFLIVG
jgi:hypothetical protein